MAENIDKDIEIVKNHIKELDEGKVLYGGFLSRKQAIENLLKELETYKKIAEKLAEQNVKACEYYYSEFDNFTKEDFIYWARKEVEKGV